MKIRKTALYLITMLFISTFGHNVKAALVTDTLLAFKSSVGCPVDEVCITNDGLVYGSYWAMDSDGDGIIEETEKVAMTPGFDGGILVGRVQPGDVIVPDPLTDGGGIDQPWNFFGNTGWHETISPITEVGDLGATKELDFSGLTMKIDGLGVIDLGGDTVNFAGDTGIATITCATSACSNNENFILDYAAHIPLNDPSGFGGTAYVLHLEGTISEVPVPGAVWLFASGILGLAGIARRKKLH